MIAIPKDIWCRDVIECGDLSEAHPLELIEKRIKRYCELVDMVDGSENSDIFKTLVDSIGDEGATEAYEATYNALWRFPPEKFATYFVANLVDFIERYGEDCARFLLGLTGVGKDSYLPLFNLAIGRLPDDEQRKIMDYIQRQENSGWFDDSIGYIKPTYPS